MQALPKGIEPAKALARQVIRGALRICATLMGVWLAAVMPVQLWADHRSAANTAAGHLPAMDPGTVVVLATFIAVAPLAAVLLIEIVRRTVMGYAPLAVPSAFALGILASWPVGAAFTVDWLHFGFTGIAVESGICVLAFYLVRRTWLTKTSALLPN
jgi:hypothetical protein